MDPKFIKNSSFLFYICPLSRSSSELELGMIVERFRYNLSIILLPVNKTKKVSTSKYVHLHDELVTWFMVLLFFNTPSPQNEDGRRSLATRSAESMLSCAWICRSTIYCCCIFMLIGLTSMSFNPRVILIKWHCFRNSQLASTLPSSTSNSSNTYPYLSQCSSTSVTQKTRQSLPVLGSWFDIRMRVPHTRIVLKIRLRRILDMGPVIHTPRVSYYIRSHPELGPVLIAFPFANMHESNLDGPEKGVLPAVCVMHEVYICPILNI